jgi:hypothetical protein
MEKSSIFIYDSSHVYARLLKIHFDKNYEIIPVTKHYRINQIKCQKIDFSYIIINQSIEVFDLLSIINYIKDCKMVLFSTSIEEIKNRLLVFDNFMYLDLNVPKKDFLDNFKSLILL